MNTEYYLMLSLILLIGAIAIGLVGVFYFRRQQLKLEQLRLQAKIGQKTKSDFLANMSHEVRTPLHAIIGKAQLLSESALSLRQKKQVEDIVVSGESLLQMFDDLIQISQVDQNSYQSQNEEVDLEQWLATVMRGGQIFLKDKELGISYSIRPFAHFRVSGDFATLRKVLFHLIVNSYKFTPQGEVFLDAEIIDNKKLRLSLHDTGAGIDRESLAHIFETFWQGHDGHDRPTQGSGVGLAVAKKLCDYLGANLTVKSEKDKGSVFQVEMAIDVIDQKEIFAPGSITGTRVAIVDPHFMERQGLAHSLTNINCEISYNGDQPQDLAQVISQSDHLVISSQLIYAKGSWNEAYLTILEKFKENVTVLFPHTGDLSLIRKFSRQGLTRYLQRPFYCANILQQDFHYDETSVGGERKRILLVDDEPDFLILLEESINEQLDLQVFKVQSGQEGFDLLTTKNIDLIVLDIEMKGIGGIEFFNRMQAMGIDLPVLFLSAHYLDEDLLNNVDGKFLYRDKYAGMDEIMRSISTLLMDRGDAPTAVTHAEVSTIMVVDDSDVNTSLLEMMLTDLGCKLVFAFNGREAVDCYQKEHPQIVLMDLQMPIMDGFEATAQIRDWEKRHERAPAYIFALSAYSTDDEINHAETVGCNAYLTKPIKRAALLEALEPILEKVKK